MEQKNFTRPEQKLFTNTSLQDLSLAYATSITSSIRYLIRELKINPYYGTTIYINGKKIALILV